MRDTWLKAIKNKNYASRPGLTYENAKKYCPSADETIKGHLVQSRQGVRLTQPKVQHKQQQVPALPSTNDIHIIVELISRRYTDDTGRFPSKACNGNQYLMLAFHSDTNDILVAPFKPRKAPQ